VSKNGVNGVYKRVKVDAGRIDVLFANADDGVMLPLGTP
jgi:hypothetical protein